MTDENRIVEDLRRMEDAIFEARHLAGKHNYAQIYGKLDDALLLVQKLGIGLKLKSEFSPKS